MRTISTRRITSFIILGLLLVGTWAITGCGQPTSQTPAPAPNSGTPSLSGTLTVAGSTSVQPFSEVLAEEFKAKTQASRSMFKGAVPA